MMRPGVMMRFDHYRAWRRRNHNNCRSGRRWRSNYHCRSGRRRRHRAEFEIRRPSRWYRTMSGAAPLPGAVIPVPVLITRYPGAFPPIVTVFGDHYHCRRRRRRRRRRRHHIALFRRENYIIQIAEESVPPARIGTVIDAPPGNVSADTGTPGEDAPGSNQQCNFDFIFHRRIHIGWLRCCLPECRGTAQSIRRLPESAPTAASSLFCRYRGDGGQ